MQRTSLTTEQIVQLRPARNSYPDPSVHAGVQDEWEPDGNGGLAWVRTVFLTGGECRFHCLMCDLWQYTLPAATQAGTLAKQLRQALEVPCLENHDPIASPSVKWLKIYNGSNFFDSRNVPRQELRDLAELCRGFNRVIVENHPKLLRPEIETFRDLIDGDLEIGMGLETIHPDVLPRLNKQMTLADFEKACETLDEKKVTTRAFVLLGLPWTAAEQAVSWAVATVEFARQCNVRHCSIIPTRSGNGAIDHLAAGGEFAPPTANMLEQALQKCLANETYGHDNADVSRTRQMVVTVDLWDWNKLAGTCDRCRELRYQRLHEMNLRQCLLPEIKCSICEV